jgi:choline dehydrogenase-like flavoprotein
LFLGLSVASNIVAPALGEITRNGLLDRSKESEARVKEIETDASGLASALVYVDANGRARRQRAKVIILCANGVGTPRLLLMLGGSRYPDGLANSSGLVGKRLMMHPFASILASYEDPLDSWRGPFGHQVYSLEFYETDERRGFVRGSKWNCMPSGGPVGVSGAMGSKVYVAGEGRFQDFWGENLHQNVARRFGHSLIWGIVGEDLPETANQVTLSKTLVDSDGLPAPHIVHKVNENSHRLLQFNIDRCLESVRAAGAIETLVSVPVRESGWHLIGTTVMGADPKTSVVDQWGAAHDIPLRHGRQHISDLRSDEPDSHDHGPCVAQHTPPDRGAPQPASRLRGR